MELQGGKTSNGIKTEGEERRFNLLSFDEIEETRCKMLGVESRAKDIGRAGWSLD